MSKKDALKEMPIFSATAEFRQKHGFILLAPCYRELVYHRAVYVVRDGQEIEHFEDEKKSGAWLRHVYGAKSPQIEVKRLKDRGPSFGDAVWHDGKEGGQEGGYYVGGWGILHSLVGNYSICFGASTYREGHIVSCSGGPLPWVNRSTLTFNGFRRTTYWRWYDGVSGAGKGGDYTINVPCWIWSGESGADDPTS